MHFICRFCIPNKDKFGKRRGEKQQIIEKVCEFQGLFLNLQRKRQLITNLNNSIMKKIFTLISLAFIAISVNAQGLPDNVYPYKDITWGDITWKNGNNKTDINDAAGTKLYFVMGQGNAYKNIYCESFISEDSGDEVNRPYYTYIDYENGEKGVPGYGLYYKFTPAVSGALRVQVWINKGSRKTVVAKGSTGEPLKYGVDYQFEGYVNGQRANDETRPLLNEDGTPKLDNQDNPTYEQYQIFFTAEEMLERHNNAKVVDGVDTAPFVLDAGNQALWGWITLNVEAGESYYFFQLSSQLGFGGYDFTPAGGEKESYAAALAIDNEIVLNDEFKVAVDDNGVAKVTTDKGSVINLGTTNMKVEAVGSSTPTSITPDKEGTGISVAKADFNASAPIYNIAGQRVNESFKGVVIQNGRKFLSK